MRFLTSLLPYLLSTQTLLTLPIAALPASHILPRAGSDPGIGVELEWRNGIIKNPDQRAFDAKNNNEALAKLKGSTIMVEGKKTSTDEWKLTAEHGGDVDSNGLRNLVYEWIVLGEVVKLDKGSNKLPTIAEEIKNALVSPRPLHLAHLLSRIWMPEFCTNMLYR